MKMKYQDTGAMWAITDAGLHDYFATMKRIDAVQDFQALAEEKEKPTPSLLSVHDGVGVVNISGPLVSQGDWLTKLFGITSYPEIYEAIVQAASDESVEKIILDIDSPGGQVSGMDTVADLIAAVDKKVKPVFTYTGGTMASAAYMLGVSAREVHATKMSMVGSIGTILQTMDFTEQMQREGVKVNVIRGGKYKQMGNPYEPLSAEGRETLQTLADDIYAEFVSHVAKQRQTSVQVVRANMAEGREFTGSRAKKVGLVDKTSGFDSLFSYVKRYVVDKQGKFGKNTRMGAMNMNTQMTAMSAALQEALVAAGEEVDLAMESQVETQATTIETVEPEVTEPETVIQAEVLADEIEADVEAVVEAEVLAPKLDALEAQIETLTAQLVDLRVENAAMAKQVEASSQTLEAMTEIVGKSTNSMCVAMNQGVQSFESWTPEMVLTAYNSAAKEFKASFKAGGVGKAVVKDPSKQKSSAASIDAARINATQL